MKTKQTLVILIVVVLAIIACLTAYTIVNSHEESLSTLRISNSCTIEAPISENGVEHLDGGITKFTFDSSGLNITHQKSGNNSEIKSMNIKLMKNSENIEGNIYYDSSSGIYSTFIENNGTGDALLITSTNLDLLKRVADSVKFKNPTTPEVNNTTEEVDDSYVEYEDTSYEGYDYYQYYDYSNVPAETDSNNEPKQENATG